MNSRRNYYVSKRSQRKSIAAGIGAIFMVFAAVACVAMAVLIMLEYRMPTNRGVASVVSGLVSDFMPDVQPVYAPVETTQALNISPPPLWPDPPPEQANTESPPPTPEPTPQPTQEPSPEPEIIAPTPPPMPIPTPTPLPIDPTPRQPDGTPFYAFPFYIAENAHLYDYFQSIRPDLDNETIVWKVNSHLHLPFYYYVRINFDPNPLLINPFYRLPPGFIPNELVPVNNEECILRATPETVAAFRSLRSAAQQNQLDLSVTSAFRTAARQAELFEQQGFRDGVVARPYHSEHQTGRALDLWGPGGLLDARGPSVTGIWVAGNAHYHGFIIRYRAETTHITGYIYEPWHITYVGLEISMYMHVNDILSLEEFVGRNPGVMLI